MKRVILAIDNQNRAQDIQNQLRQIRCDVIATTATADEVITRADELRPDIILTDVKLKGGAAWIEAVKQIKSLHYIPIIFITADSDEATVRRAIAAEPNGFLITPLDKRELMLLMWRQESIKRNDKRGSLTFASVSSPTRSLSSCMKQTKLVASPSSTQRPSTCSATRKKSSWQG